LNAPPGYGILCHQPKEAPMPTRNIVLTDQQSAFIDALVSAGRFQNASEALRAGLRLLEDDEQKRTALIARLTESYAQVQRGEFAEGTIDEIFARAFSDARERAGI
jgi:antitoxin ParD1/3/4